MKGYRAISVLGVFKFLLSLEKEEHTEITEILDLRADCSTEILRMNVACNGLLEFDPLLKNRATF
jgi:hypothetical protein